MKYPLNYDAIGVCSEEALLSYLHRLSIQNNTRYRKIKNEKLLNVADTNAINLHLPEAVNKTKRVVLYGTGGHGTSVYRRLEVEGIDVQGIVDGNKGLSGVKLGAHYIYSPDYLKKITCDLILVCSITHKDDIITNIHNIVGKDIEIVTLGQMIKCSEYSYN